MPGGRSRGRDDLDAAARGSGQYERPAGQGTREGGMERVCRGSLIRLRKKRRGRYPLAFSNPADVKRRNMTVRLSFDDGATWPASKPLYEGPSAYSCLATLGGRELGCLYER